jgi:hypothetical protein
MARLARQLPLALALAMFAALAFFSRSAGAEPPNPKATPVYVLDIETEDADDQADALTQALRSRVRLAQGWSLLETGQSLGKLIVVLKCPTKPDAPCLQRIGDTIRADRFLWGQMSKKNSQVTVELHLWSRGKPDARTSETYSDNLKDPNEESLRKIASRLFAQATGSSATGTVTVRAGTANGTVLVDGQEKGKLENGVAKVEVPTGAHTIAVRVPGFELWSQPVTVGAAADQEIAATLTPAKAEPPPVVVTTKSLPVRKIAAYTAIGVGGASMIIGVVEGFHFLSLKSDLDGDRGNVSSNVTDVCQDLSTNAAIDACQKYKDAKSARILEWVFLGVGAALVTGGVVLLVTDHSSDDAAKDKAGAFKVLPHVGPRSAGLDLHVAF